MKHKNTDWTRNNLIMISAKRGCWKLFASASFWRLIFVSYVVFILFFIWVEKKNEEGRMRHTRRHIKINIQQSLSWVANETQKDRKRNFFVFFAFISRFSLEYYLIWFPWYHFLPSTFYLAICFHQRTSLSSFKIVVNGERKETKNKQF